MFCFSVSNEIQYNDEMNLKKNFALKSVESIDFIKRT